MLKDGFLRFCDDPEIACCRGEAELGQLRNENAQLRSQLLATQRRADAAVEDLYKACRHTPCNTGICVKKNCTGNHIPCEFEWRGLEDARTEMVEEGAENERD